MSRIAVIFVASFFFIAPFLSAADSATPLFQILQLIDQKKYEEAIAGYQQYMQTAPPWFQGPIQFEIATLLAAQGEKREALSTMETAIESGFDDCFAVKQYPEWNAFRDNFQFATLHAKMTMSEVDFRELAWLKEEIHSNRDETNTELARVEIPTRQTTSAAVLFNRELLNVLQTQSAMKTQPGIQQRKFSLPSSAGTQPRACIELK